MQPGGHLAQYTFSDTNWSAPLNSGGTAPVERQEGLLGTHRR